ncbi:hypothetical protein [Nocardia iowensis]|uniref:DNA primase/polymerase bifunctional N-terminal domain-containing protein n=1 Tax=Nocardia iowensis TaxID=204891 RepID=A0ABX8RRB6_NOCIO|nr:hypothetical protein [Nocardia iowensis]QXN91442.1 hypothetical protein KV110_40090 [Nocardia iowensis]
MFERCHSPLEIAHLLRHLYGLPVQLVAGRPMVTTGSVLGAIVMPPELGREVLAALDHTNAAPVIADPGARSWTFLVAPPSPARPVEVPVRRSLAAHQVVVIPGGRNIMLPTTDSPLGWHWAAEPTPGALRMPPRTAVINAVHQVTTLQTSTP